MAEQRKLNEIDSHVHEVNETGLETKIGEYNYHLSDPEEDYSTRKELFTALEKIKNEDLEKIWYFE